LILSRKNLVKGQMRHPYILKQDTPEVKPEPAPIIRNLVATLGTPRPDLKIME
jgi:hypothetical protein